MNEKEVKKCPKCGSEMKCDESVIGSTFFAIRIRKEHDFYGDKIIPYSCSNCGYIELYNEKNVRKE